MSITLRKITVALPAALVDYADDQAHARQTSRSRFIAEALLMFETSETERLAAEGYRFYASDSAEFAESIAGSVAEVFGHDG